MSRVFLISQKHIVRNIEIQHIVNFEFFFYIRINECAKLILKHVELKRFVNHDIETIRKTKTFYWCVFELTINLMMYSELF